MIAAVKAASLAVAGILLFNAGRTEGLVATELTIAAVSVAALIALGCTAHDIAASSERRALRQLRRHHELLRSAQRRTLDDRQKLWRFLHANGVEPNAIIHTPWVREPRPPFSHHTETEVLRLDQTLTHLTIDEGPTP